MLYCQQMAKKIDKKGLKIMAENVEKLEAKIKALQAKKREAAKKEKAKQQKAEFERLKEFEKQVLALDSFEQIQLKVNRWNEINNTARKYGLKMADVSGVLEKVMPSIKSQQQNN